MQRRCGRNIDDRAAWVFCQMGQRVGADKIVGIQIGGAEYLPPLAWRVVRRNTAMLASASCIVNHHIKPAKLFHDRIDHEFYGIFIGDIRFKEISIAALVG